MKLKAALAALMFVPVQVFAWGAVGHRTVGLIADSQLTPIARSAIQKVLGSATLADVANWADSLKSTGQYQQTIWYHFDKMPAGVSYVDHLSRLSPQERDRGGVTAAILVAIHQLRDPGFTPADKAVALKFLVHFVGDLHQPLHSGPPETNGGNKTPIVWFGTAMNLHSVWDSGMIMTGHSDILDPQASVEHLSMIYAQYLSKHLPAFRWSAGVDVESWLSESLAIRPQALDPRAQTDQGAYQSLNLPAIDARIVQAGTRLANLLNEICSGAPPSAVETSFWQRTLQVFPNIEKAISFRP